MGSPMCVGHQGHHAAVVWWCKPFTKHDVYDYIHKTTISNTSLHRFVYIYIYKYDFIFYTTHLCKKSTCNSYLKFVLTDDGETATCRVATVSLPCASGQIEKKWPDGNRRMDGNMWWFPEVGVPPNGWFVMENTYVSMDDLRVNPILGNHHIIYIYIYVP